MRILGQPCEFYLQDQRLSGDARRAQVGGYSEAAGGGCEAYAHDAAGGYDDDAVQIGICSHGR